VVPINSKPMTKVKKNLGKKYRKEWIQDLYLVMCKGYPEMSDWSELPDQTYKDTMLWNKYHKQNTHRMKDNQIWWLTTTLSPQRVFVGWQVNWQRVWDLGIKGLIVKNKENGYGY
jgi:hypothetical protein